MWARLTDTDGRPNLINMSNIVRCVRHVDGTFTTLASIAMEEGHPKVYHVKEDLDEIAVQIQNWQDGDAELRGLDE